MFMGLPLLVVKVMADLLAALDCQRKSESAADGRGAEHVSCRDVVQLGGAGALEGDLVLRAVERRACDPIVGHVKPPPSPTAPPSPRQYPATFATVLSSDQGRGMRNERAAHGRGPRSSVSGSAGSSTTGTSPWSRRGRTSTAE